MTDSFSLLQTINQKELEVRRRIEEAHQQAEARVQAAREEAEQTIARADQEAQTEAEVLYRRKIKETQKEADALITAGREQANGLRSQAMTRLDYAARQVMELVLPDTVSLVEQIQKGTHSVSQSIPE